MLARAVLLALAAAFCLARAEGLITASQPVVVYDAPSKNGRPLYLLGLHYPLLPISATAGWYKVCLHDGDTGFVNRRDTRTGETAVILSRTAVRAKPQSSSRVIFNAARGLLLNVRGEPVGNWLPVQHSSGKVGYADFRAVFAAATGGSC